VVFVLQNALNTTAELSGLKLTTITSDNVRIQFDLVLSITESDGALDAAMLYNRDLFDRDTIARMIEHWQTLLRSIVENPDLQLSSLRMLTEAEMGGLTLSDFPIAELSQADFEKLCLEINEGTAAV